MKRKLNRYYAIKLTGWDCNNHPLIQWNIIDRSIDLRSNQDPRIGQAWSKKAMELMIRKLNK